MSISKERFDAVPRRRFRYILLYLVIMGTWAVTTAGEMLALLDVQEQPAPAADSGTETGPDDEEGAAATGAEPGEEGDPSLASQNGPGGWFKLPSSTFDTRLVVALYASRLVLMAFFVIDFVFVFKTMGYPVAMIAVASVAVGLFPLPGLLLVAFMDRRVSKAWRNANDAIGEG